jgi:hypothetical protein
MKQAVNSIARPQRCPQNRRKTPTSPESYLVPHPGRPVGPMDGRDGRNAPTFIHSTAFRPYDTPVTRPPVSHMMDSLPLKPKGAIGLLGGAKQARRLICRLPMLLSDFRRRTSGGSVSCLASMADGQNHDFFSVIAIQKNVSALTEFDDPLRNSGGSSSTGRPISGCVPSDLTPWRMVWIVGAL